MSVGGAVTYEHKNAGTCTNSLAISPSVRYTYIRTKDLTLFVDGGVGFLGYRDDYMGHPGGGEGGFRLSGSDLSFGLYYAF